MPHDRRTFLQSVSVGALAALAGATDLAAAPAEPAPRPTLPDFDPAHPDAYWRAVRAGYPLQADPVYLNAGGLGPAPQRVLDRVFATMTEMQAHSEPEHERRIGPARRELAAFVGVKPAEFCFVRNTTEGTAVIAAGLALHPGDEVIFESHAHPGGSYPWYNQAKERGVQVRLFEPDPTSPEGNVARIRALITPRTKVIQVSHIVCTTGLVMPVAEIAALAREHGIWCHLDGAQVVGMQPVDIDAIGCDSYAFSGHKWLGGPHETGGFYLRQARIDEVALTGVGSHSGELPFLPGTLKPEPTAWRHEYGTRNLGLIAGLVEATRLQQEIGRDRIAAYGRGLAAQLFAGLDAIPGIEVLSPRPAAMRSAMTTFRHPRANAAKFSDYLKRQHRLRCRPVSEQHIEAVRVSTHLFNSAAECERVIAAVHASTREL